MNSFTTAKKIGDKQLGITAKSIRQQETNIWENHIPVVTIGFRILRQSGYESCHVSGLAIGDAHQIPKPPKKRLPRLNPRKNSMSGSTFLGSKLGKDGPEKRSRAAQNKKT